MDGHATGDDDEGPSATALVPAAVNTTVAATPAVDAPRRCFICLTDQDPADAADSWVDPCPCTLEAHQDCMLSWVTDCERSNKPLMCPVCKSAIELEGLWDPVVAATDALHRRFTRVSPLILFTGASMGAQLSLQMYGAMAFWAFAGKDALMRFLLGPKMVLDATAAGRVAFAKDRFFKAMALMNVAPVLLVARFFPGLSHRVFFPTATVCGMYKIIHDDDFLAWPPSPQLAMTVFPYIQGIYYYLWKELAFPYEVKLNRQLMGLPPLDEPPAAGQQPAQDRGQALRNADGGVLGILQGILDALEPDDDDRGHAEPVNHHFQFLHGDHFEFEDDVDDGNQGDMAGEIMLEVEIGEVDLGQVPMEEAQPVVDLAGLNEGGGDARPDGGADAAEERRGHEAPQPPPRRLGIGVILSTMSNAVVGALILPAISLAMGEALRLALPRAWTAGPAPNPWARHGGAVGRPGLLQQQWGRSLIGGCLYVAIKDAVRLYTKSRRVAAMQTRRVRNVERRGRGRGGGTAP